MKLTEEQTEALRALSLAYGNLSKVWPDEWNGEENFGGVLDHAGVLPRRDLMEAEVELLNLIDNE